MRGAPQRHYSEDDYFAVEVSSPIKHELYAGEIFAMAGASVAHNQIVSNIVTALQTALRDKGCRVFPSDLRVRTPAGLYTYPDVSVICGAVELVPGRPDTVTNPIVVVEVLSEATRDYDRGEKFDLYATLGSLREYLLIEQSCVAVERRSRPADDWATTVHTQLHEVLALAPPALTLALADVYRDVF